MCCVESHFFVLEVLPALFRRTALSFCREVYLLFTSLIALTHTPGGSQEIGVYTYKVLSAFIRQERNWGTRYEFLVGAALDFFPSCLSGL